METEGWERIAEEYGKGIVEGIIRKRCKEEVAEGNGNKGKGKEG